MKKKGKKQSLDINNAEQASKDIDGLLKEMIFQDFWQNIRKRQRQGSEISSFLYDNQNLYSMCLTQNSHIPRKQRSIDRYSNNQNSISLTQQLNNENGVSFNQNNSQIRRDKRNSSSKGQRNNSQYRISTNSQSQGLKTDLIYSDDRILSRIETYSSNISIDKKIMYRMVDHNIEFQTVPIQVQKYLFNYLYEQVSNNQHIVKSLIDEFGVLICEKFQPLLDMNLIQFNNQTQCNTELHDIIVNDIIFLIDFIKDYLKQIYGENVLSQQLFNDMHKDVIFDIFVRKIVFDDNNICSIAMNAIVKAMHDEQMLLIGFMKKVKDKLNFKNAFINNAKLQFLSNLNYNPFEVLNVQFKKIEAISSPFLKRLELKEIRNNVLEILRQIMKEQNINKQLEIPEYLQIYFFIFTQINVSIYVDIKFIEKYGSEKNNREDMFFITFQEVFTEILEYAQDDRVDEFINYMFYDISQKDQQNNQIEEEDENISLSSKYQSQQLINCGFQFQNQKTQKQIYYPEESHNVINAQSASSHTITDQGVDSCSYSKQLIYSQSEILSTTKRNQTNNFINKKQKINKNKGIQYFSTAFQPFKQDDKSSNTQNDNNYMKPIKNPAIFSSLHIEERKEAHIN